MNQYLTDAEVASLEDQQIYIFGLIGYRFQPVSEAVLVRREFLVARLLERAETYEDLKLRPSTSDRVERMMESRAELIASAASQALSDPGQVLNHREPFFEFRHLVLERLDLFGRPRLQGSNSCLERSDLRY